jgi:tripartite-type tricarboxylate transporter receptor subunit TctC
MRRRELLALTGIAASVAASSALQPWRALAQAPGVPYPAVAGTVTIVSPFTAGGTTDILARIIADKLAPVLGRTVIVDNRPGAGGAIGSTAAARAAPDGLTLLVGHIGTLGVNPSLYASLGYDPLKSFDYVAPLALVPNVLVVHPAVPAADVPELIVHAKANAGKLNYSSAGQGSAAHIAMAAFNIAAGTTMTHVPYRGTSQSVGDLIAGQVQLTMTGVLSVLPHVRAGTLRGLGVSTLKRLAVAPEIPAIAETLKDFEASQWYGLVAPAGTPPQLVERLTAEIRTIMTSPDIAARLAREGAEHWDISPDAFRAHVAAEIPRWKGVIEAAKIKVE